jgi:predicted metal-dependent hydrolase
LEVSQVSSSIAHIRLGPFSWVTSPATTIRDFVEGKLKELAHDELTRRTFELASAYNLEFQSVTVRNQRTRWGSCSSHKCISLNWRLVQTPNYVRDYIITHELMHLLEMNHSTRFWKKVEEHSPLYLKAELWLRKDGKLLR